MIKTIWLGEYPQEGLSGENPYLYDILNGKAAISSTNISQEYKEGERIANSPYILKTVYSDHVDLEREEYTFIISDEKTPDHLFHALPVLGDPIHVYPVLKDTVSEKSLINDVVTPTSLGMIPIIIILVIIYFIFMRK